MVEEVTKKGFQMFRMESRGWGVGRTPASRARLKAVTHIARANKFTSGTKTIKLGHPTPPRSPMDPGPDPLLYSLVLCAQFVSEYL